MFCCFSYFTFKGYISTCSCVLVCAVRRKWEHLEIESCISTWYRRNDHRHIGVCDVEGRDDGISGFPVDRNDFGIGGTRTGQKYLHREKHGHMKRTFKWRCTPYAPSAACRPNVKKELVFTSMFSERLFSLMGESAVCSEKLHVVPVMLSLDLSCIGFTLNWNSCNGGRSLMSSHHPGEWFI